MFTQVPTALCKSDRVTLYKRVIPGYVPLDWKPTQTYLGEARPIDLQTISNNGNKTQEESRSIRLRHF